MTPREVSCSDGRDASSRIWTAPDQRLVLDHQVVREHLNVFRRVLDFIPLPLDTRTKVPIAVRPATYLFQGFKVLLKLGRCRNLSRAE